MEKKEVQNNTLKNEFELDSVLRLLKSGLTKKQVRDKLNISKSNLSYYLSKLENSNNIKREGKNIVKVLSSSIIHPRVTRNHIVSKLNKRGHAHNFKILFPQEIEDLRIKPLVKKYHSLDYYETTELEENNTTVIKIFHKKYVYDNCYFLISKLDREY